MIHSVLMPKLGETDAFTFTIEKWLLREGDPVAKGQALLSVATDKTSIDVEARTAGVLRKIIFDEGEEVTVGTAIAVIAPADALIPEAMLVRKLAPAATKQPAATPSVPSTRNPEPETRNHPSVRNPEPETRNHSLPRSPVPLPREGLPAMSPRARRRARELHVPLQALPIPADGRRITERDVLAAAEARKQQPADSADAPLRLPAERVPMNPMRRQVAANMAYSQQVIPQFSVEMLVLSNPLLAYRKKIQPEFPENAKPSVEDFFIRALGVLLVEERYKAFRAVVDGADLVFRGEINVGFAVATGEDGVVVPVLRGVDRLSFKELVARRNELSTRAQKRNLKSSESSGALLTLSNLGNYGVHAFRAIVRPGESAILALPEAQPRPLWSPARSVEIQPTWQLSLSADHRVVDGALAAHFLQDLKRLLECPERLI